MYPAHRRSSRIVLAGYLKHKSVSVPPYDEHVPYITSEPDVRVHQLQDGDSFFIMGDYTHP